MNSKKKKQNACIKVINNRCYVYSWSYRPKATRNSNNNRRYDWKLQGRYNSEKAERFLNANFSIKEREVLKRECQKKIQREKQIQKQVLHMAHRQPFKEEKEKIKRMHFGSKRDIALNSFNKKLRKIAKRKFDKRS